MADNVVQFRLVVNGQSISPYGDDQLVADSVNFVDVTFIMDDSWDGLECVAQFYQDDAAYNQVLQDGKCKLPTEIHAGSVEIGVFGQKGNVTIRSTTNKAIVQVQESSFHGDGQTPVPPTPDLYSQLLEKIDQIEAATGKYADAAKQSANAAKVSEHAAAGSAKESEESASKSAESAKEAERAKNEATAEMGKVQDAGEAAVSEISQTKTKAVQDVLQAGAEAVNAVDQAEAQVLSDMQSLGSALIGSINAAGGDALDGIAAGKDQALQVIEASRASALEEVNGAGTAQVGAVNTAGQAQQTTIQQAGETATQQVQQTGVEQVNKVSQAGDDKMQQIADINALLPTPAEADAGKVVAVNSDGSGYELGEVQTDAYTKAESDARYAPIEAAIRPTVSGNPATLEHSVAWAMQGLNVYGKSTQDGTPSPDSPVPIVTAGTDGSIDITVSDGADQSQQLIIQTPNGLPGIPVDSGGNFTDADGQQWVCDEVDFQRGVYVQRAGKLSISDFTLPVGVKPDTTGSRYAAVTPNRVILVRQLALCNCFPYNAVPRGSYSTEGNYIATDEEGKVFIRLTESISLENFHQLYPDLVAYYQFETPIETPLSPEELAAYAALRSYNGTTIVSTEEDIAGMSARAVVDPEKYIESKIDSAIASALEVN